MPRLRSSSRICGTAAAASSRSTVIRTISEPARESAATCATVPATSAVSVLVIDCTTIGAPPPTATLPTMTWVVLRRALGPATSSCGGFTGWFMEPQISGFGDIHHGGRRQVCAHHHCGRFGIFRPFLQSLSPAIQVQSKGLPAALCQTVYWTGIPRLKGKAPTGGRLFIVDGTP